MSGNRAPQPDTAALSESVGIPAVSLMKSGIASDSIDFESSSVNMTFGSGGIVYEPGICDTKPA